ncbi:MAG: FAD-binding protein, partial [Oscillospiraceae bacterium]
MANLDLIVRALRAQCPGLEILEHEPMRAHCSFRIGGPARALVRPASAEETAAVCRIVRGGGAQPLIIGNGTNLLITDGALERIVVQMGDNMAAVTQPDATHLSAGAGIPLARLAQAALGCGLAGLEFAHGIPGSLGGAVSMNAGAYGGEMKDVVVSTRYLDGELRLCEAHGSAHDFGYRHSAFSDTDCVLLGSTLALTPGDPADIQARMRDLSERRRSRQPLDLPSAGSTFKRP